MLLITSCAFIEVLNPSLKNHIPHINSETLLHLNAAQKSKGCVCVTKMRAREKVNVFVTFSGKQID